MRAMKVAKKKSAKPAAGGSPFPFFGQGDASYYEWFEMWVWFKDPVPKSERAAVLKGAPKPCARAAEWPNASLLWPSTGDQWIHKHLIEAYGSARAKARYARAAAREARGEDLFDDDEDEAYLDLLACDGEEKRLNQDIERWLRDVHARWPILFAARREDDEAGGTKLGAWHKASIKRFAADVLPTFEALAKKGLPAKDLRREAISVVVEYVGEKKVKPAIRKLAKTPD